MVRISIIVPVYNVEDFLPACVDSILAQTDPDFELLLIDDGATDGSGRLCDQYAEKDKRIRVIHQENKGLGGARNTGIEAATGSHLLFIDSDDMIAPQTVARLREAQALLDTDLLIFMYDTVDEAGAHLQDFVDDFPMEQVLSIQDHPAENGRYLLGAPVAWNRLYRRSLFVETGVRFPGRVWYEDIRTTIKLMVHAKRIAFLPDVLYRYRMREGSITKNIHADRNVEILEAFEDLFSYFRGQGLFEAYRIPLGFLTVSHVYIAASVRVLRIDPNHPLLERFRAFLLQEFPGYRSNPMMTRLSRNQRIVMWLLDRRMYRTIRMIFKIKG